MPAKALRMGTLTSGGAGTVFGLFGSRENGQVFFTDVTGENSGVFSVGVTGLPFHVYSADVIGSNFQVGFNGGTGFILLDLGLGASSFFLGQVAKVQGILADEPAGAIPRRLGKRGARAVILEGCLGGHAM